MDRLAPWRPHGLFLDGTPLKHAKGHDIVSDGVAMGAIQVPGNGLPIILMADRQSTGGYPKMATVIGPDLGRLAQAQGGTRIAFQGSRSPRPSPLAGPRRMPSRAMFRVNRCCARISRRSSCWG